MYASRLGWLLVALCSTTAGALAETGEELLDRHHAEAEAATAPPGAPAFGTFKAAYAARDQERDGGAVPLAKLEPGGHYDNVPAGQNPFATDPALAERDAVVAANQETLQLIRQGLGEVYLQPKLSPGNLPIQWNFRNRSMMRLLRIEAESHAGHGRWSAAVGSACDLVAFGGKIQHGGGIMSQMVGAVGYHLAIEDLRLMLPCLDRAALTVALTRFPQAIAEQAPMADVVANELDIDSDFNKIAFEDPDWREGIKWLLDYGVASERVAAITPERTAAGMVEYRSRILPLVEQPFGSVPLPELPDDALAAYTVQNIPTAWALHQRDQARQQVMLVSLALRAYELDHGAEPPNLEAVVPEYLSSVPTDPFTGASLTYRRTADGYLLYSLGPNRQDDGGAKFVFPKHPSEAANFLTAAGDIVE